MQAIAGLLVTQPREHWLTLFAQHRIPSGPINSIDQLVNDIPLRESGLFFAAQGAAGVIPQVGLGIQFDGDSAVFRSPPPALGQDTERILTEELSMSAACVAGLIDSEIV